MEAKLQEIDEAVSTGEFGPSKSFFLSKASIESSKVFAFVQAMPKGAALHTHHISLGSIRWIVSNLTYWENLYMKYDDTMDTLEFAWFTKDPKSSKANLAMWHSVNEARRIFGQHSVDKFLTRYLSCGIDTIKTQDININTIWQSFKRAVISIHGIIFYLPAFKAYLYNALSEMLADNIQHVQIRTSLPTICRRTKDLGCAPLSKYEAARAYLEVTTQFEQDHSSDYCGTAVIIAQSRKVSTSVVDTHLKLAAELQEKHPEFFIGFDLVGQEDLGKPLVDFAPQLIQARANYPNLKFFFHAGETDWHDSHADLNVIDAILLNATRIGHGYSITKHPEALKLIKEHDIPIEVCPISNQVLGLVNDLRNHPAVHLVLGGYPIVVASDDVASWGAQGLSDDFYELFMAMSARHSDLRLLKKLAWNSIRYSALRADRRLRCQRMWEAKWLSFTKAFN